MPHEYVEPLGRRILVRKDEARQQTRGGIVLPDDAEIPTITGRVVEISALIERDMDWPVRKYDKVLFHPAAGDPGRPGGRQPAVRRADRGRLRRLPPHPRPGAEGTERAEGGRRGVRGAFVDGWHAFSR